MDFEQADSFKEKQIGRRPKLANSTNHQCPWFVANEATMWRLTYINFSEGTCLAK